MLRLDLDVMTSEVLFDVMFAETSVVFETSVLEIDNMFDSFRTDILNSDVSF